MSTNRLLISILLATLILALAGGCSPDPEPLPTVIVDPAEGGYAGLSHGPNDNSIVNIHMVYPSQERAETLAKKHMDNLGWRATREVRTVKVKYSKAQLDHWRKNLWNEDIPKVAGTGFDLLENRIYFTVLCGSELERTEKSIRERMRLLGIPQDSVRVEVSVSGPAGAMLPEAPYDYDCLPEEVIDPVTGFSSPGFGGFYFGPDGINVYLLNPSQMLAEELALDFYGKETIERNGGVRAVRGQYTWDQLHRWWVRMRENGKFYVASFPCIVDNERNRLTMEVSKSTGESTIKWLEAVLSNFGIPREAVIFVRKC